MLLDDEGRTAGVVHAYTTSDGRACEELSRVVGTISVRTKRRTRDEKVPTIEPLSSAVAGIWCNEGVGPATRFWAAVGASRPAHNRELDVRPR
ncbi:hypothetical protein RirG_084270 [Rhizophagus irregularis DAOM 197198w]|uniref:Uncharacterized protein n=1 Tax=Rhizophagus irregularis (strain DAOM 197198w) TaxID=1432141 RepID=A0A015JMR4_RHIIW|nr:hypothetical protein RirG_084270 [Rhizophagus irregularis DAOM 197198w]